MTARNIILEPEGLDIGSQYLSAASLRALLETSPQDMGPTPSSPFSSLSSDDPPEEGLPAQGTGLSDPTCSNVVMRRKLLELVKSLG